MKTIKMAIVGGILGFLLAKMGYPFYTLEFWIVFVLLFIASF